MAPALCCLIRSPARGCLAGPTNLLPHPSITQFLAAPAPELPPSSPAGPQRQGRRAQARALGAGRPARRGPRRPCRQLGGRGRLRLLHPKRYALWRDEWLHAVHGMRLVADTRTRLPARRGAGGAPSPCGKGPQRGAGRRPCRKSLGTWPLSNPAQPHQGVAALRTKPAETTWLAQQPARPFGQQGLGHRLPLPANGSSAPSPVTSAVRAAGESESGSIIATSSTAMPSNAICGDLHAHYGGLGLDGAAAAWQAVMVSG